MNKTQRNSVINYYMINGVAAEYLYINDRAIHYGDGLFETILCRNRKLYYWKQHYQRLQLSSEKLKIDCPDEQLLLADIKALLAANENLANNGCVVKIIVTRGSGERGYQIPKAINANRIVLLSSMEPEYSSLLSARLLKGDLYLCEQQVSINESLAGMKHLNRLENVLARNEWDVKDNKIVDGLMLNANHHVIEGTMSNVFAVKDKQLLTPDLTQSGIKGIMRDEIINIANNIDIEVSITNMSINELAQMDGLFITNSLIGMKSIDKFIDNEYKATEVTILVFENLLKTKDDYVQVI